METRNQQTNWNVISLELPPDALGPWFGVGDGRALKHKRVRQTGHWRY